jgi:hypothetical protein
MLAVESPQQREHFLGALRIQVAGRFIRKQQRRVHRERTCERVMGIKPTRHKIGQQPCQQPALSERTACD